MLSSDPMWTIQSGMSFNSISQKMENIKIKIYSRAEQVSIKPERKI